MEEDALVDLSAYKQHNTRDAIYLASSPRRENPAYCLSILD
jgi:hypothetical protein